MNTQSIHTVSIPMALGAHSATATATPDQDSLLPEPAPGASLESMSALYAVMAEMRRSNRATDFGEVEEQHEHAQIAKQRLREAIKKAEEEKDEGGFLGGISKNLGTIGKVAAIAGAAALVVGTGGVGLAGVLAICAVGFSSAAFAQSEFKILQKCGVDDKTAMYTELGLVGAGALCSGGAGAAALGEGASATAAEAGSAAAEASATAAEATASNVDKIAQITGAAAEIVSGAAGAASAYTAWRAGEHAANAEEHMADAAAEQAREQQLQRMLLQLIDDIESAEEADQRTLGHLRDAIQAKGAALVAAGRV